MPLLAAPPHAYFVSRERTTAMAILIPPERMIGTGAVEEVATSVGPGHPLRRTASMSMGEFTGA